jgi:L-lactate dehydrogenase complex protein LldG
VSEARAEVLGRVRAALASGAAVPEVPRGYRLAGAVAADVDLFCERVSDYRATVRRVDGGELAAAVAAACAERGVRRLVTPAGGPTSLEGLELVADDPPLGVRDLDGVDGVLTGCALAIAETGTIVLDGGPRSGRRAITLVPDYHACVVEAADIVASVPDAIAVLADAAAEGRPITFVSGPSATSDIELDRVEGVHGPRTLDVFVVAASSA